jgi:hypothetical protein
VAHRVIWPQVPCGAVAANQANPRNFRVQARRKPSGSLIEMVARSKSIPIARSDRRSTATANWQNIVLVQHKPSTQSTIRSHIRKYLTPHFGQLQLRDIQPESIQRFIAGIDGSPKTVRNIFVTLQLMWKSARAWRYVTHNTLDAWFFPNPAMLGGSFSLGKRS